MNKRIALIGILSIVSHQLKATAPDRPIAGQGAAIGQSWISLNSNWAGNQNQAALAWQNNYWVGVHHENRYLVKELGLSSVAGVVPVSTGTFGANISHFGYSQFSISRFGFSYSMKFSDKFSAGVGLNYHHLQVAGNYDNHNAYTVEGGILYKPTEKLMLGAYLFNPTHSSLDEQESLPSLFGFGVTYFPSEKVLIALQVDDDTDNKPAFRGGVEYKALSNFAIRVGYSSGNPEGLTGGFGWTVKGIQLDLSFGYHRILGYTPQLSVSYCFGNNSNKLP